MLTQGERDAIQGALDRALVVVQSAESAASSGRNVLGTIAGLFSTGPNVLDDAASSKGLEAAAIARSLYSALQERTAALLVSPDPAHEEALEVVLMANHLAGSGLDTAIMQMDSAADAPAVIVGALVNTAKQTTALASKAAEGFGPTVRWIAVGLAAVAAIYLATKLPRRASR